MGRHASQEKTVTRPCLEFPSFEEKGRGSVCPMFTAVGAPQARFQWNDNSISLYTSDIKA